MKKIPSSEITPEHIYLSRRKFLRELGITSATAAFLAACKPQAAALNTTPTAAKGGLSTSEPLDIISSESPDLDPSVDPLTSFDDVTQYNNFYEFTTSKSGVASLAAKFETTPWSVSVTGLVNNPKNYTLDDLRGKFPQEERVYRMRCVEAWSMVIPWVGFPLASILDEVQPTSDAKYVKFTTLYDPEQMPGQNSSYPWPYVEGLRMDEAMHDLTILATGLYGKYLLPQDGAPLRLVVPWKYGFKSIKSIVEIELVSEMPVSFWMSLAPNEYGFYANVNPNVPHPRWSQATEKRIGESGRRDTLLFNGYEDEVAQLYEGMDLSQWY